MNEPSSLPRMDRRIALKWMFTAAATIPLVRQRLLADTGRRPSGAGYGTDPDLNKDYKPGELWPLTFSDDQRHTAAVLSDLVIPADEHSPSASKVGVVDFLDEWVSAPYATQKKDRTLILNGFAWLDKEAERRFGARFSSLHPDRLRAICDDLCHEAGAESQFQTASKFFARYRDLTAGGFYTTPAGMADLKYIGNMPLAQFDGPPPELLKQLGLA
jgi:hypothetical protein